MSFFVVAANRPEWERYKLLAFREFADKITTCNLGDDGLGNLGEWFFIPGTRLACGEKCIYSGLWGTRHSIGTLMLTFAEIFDMTDEDEAIAYVLQVREWETQPAVLSARR
jgi:hypothetical protein